MSRAQGVRAAVLVVDDNAANRLAAEATLGSLEDVEVVCVESGPAAIAAATRRDFAVVLLDVQMPSMDGFEAFTRLRAIPGRSTMPVVFVTAAGDRPKLLERAYGLGAVDLLHKPYAPDLLRAKVGVFVDLFEKAQRLKEVERSESFRLFAHAPMPIAVFRGREHRVHLVNDAVRALFAGHRLRSGALLRDVLPADVAAPIAVVFDRVHASGDPFVAEEYEDVSAPEAEGRRYFRLVVTPTRDASDVIDGVMVVGADVTAQVNARKAAEDAVRVREDFLSVASHELRTPLTSVQLRIESLLRRRLDDAETLGTIARGVRRMAQLIDEMLDFARLRDHELVLEKRPSDLRALVARVVDDVAGEAARKASPVRLTDGEPVVVECDAARIEESVANLLGNALKFGAGQPIAVAVEATPSEAVVTVRDGGMGIAPSDRERIFERFERGVSARHFGGLGIGLWISRAIARAHGGRIEVESEPGKGAEFRLVLPRR